MLEEKRLGELANIFLALSDRTRLRLVAAMASGEASVNLLAETVGESQPKVSRHLAYLRAMKVVTTRRDGKRIYYAVDTNSESASASLLRAAIVALGGPPATEYGPPDIPVERMDEVRQPNELAIYLL